MVTSSLFSHKNGPGQIKHTCASTPYLTTPNPPLPIPFCPHHVKKMLHRSSDVCFFYFFDSQLLFSTPDKKRSVGKQFCLCSTVDPSQPSSSKWHVAFNTERISVSAVAFKWTARKIVALADQAAGSRVKLKAQCQGFTKNIFLKLGPRVTVHTPILVSAISPPTYPTPLSSTTRATGGHPHKFVY